MKESIPVEVFYNGFTIPAGNEERIEQYRRDADPARAFLLEHYTASSNGEHIACENVYCNYCAWCETNGCRAMNERTFGQNVKRIFPTIERRRPGCDGNRQYVYQGLTSYASYQNSTLSATREKSQ